MKKMTNLSVQQERRTDVSFIGDFISLYYKCMNRVNSMVKQSFSASIKYSGLLMISANLKYTTAECDLMGFVTPISLS